MNKTSIKIIKRKDVEATATTKSQNMRESKQTASSSEEKTKRSSRREIGGTISNWISERRENNRIKADEANGEFFGVERLLNDEFR